MPGNALHPGFLQCKTCLRLWHVLLGDDLEPVSTSSAGEKLQKDKDSPSTAANPSQTPKPIEIDDSNPGSADVPLKP